MAGPGSTKVFSVTDFRHGLDVRKTPLTAPGGSLRLLENAVINQGGEIEKRLAFVPLLTLPPQTLFLLGQGAALHIFGVNALSAFDASACPVPIFPHVLTYAGSDPIQRVLDVEPYDGKFYVLCGTVSGATLAFWDGAEVLSGGTPIHGTYARTYKGKVYRLDGRYLRFSGVNNPVMEDPADATYPGAGFINVGLNDPEGEATVSMEVYYSSMAVFARLMTQIWSLDPDPDLDTLTQVLRIGTVAKHSVVQFGTGDVLFLSDSGVRSLKTLNVTLAASVSDVGSAVDPLLTALLQTDPVASADAHAVVQPIHGRYWLAVRDTVFVLSYFPAGEITAWSVFYPGFRTAEFAVAVNMVFARNWDTNQLYLYGGVSQTQYDSCQVVVRTPHLAAEGPTARKRVKSVDVMCEGTWSLSLGMLPNNTDAFELVATVTNNTFGAQSIPFAGYGTHIGAHLVHAAPGPAKLAAIHYNIEEGSTK